MALPTVASDLTSPPCHGSPIERSHRRAPTHRLCIPLSISCSQGQSPALAPNAVLPEFPQRRLASDPWAVRFRTTPGAGLPSGCGENTCLAPAGVQLSSPTQHWWWRWCSLPALGLCRGHSANQQPCPSPMPCQPQKAVGLSVGLLWAPGLPSQSLSPSRPGQAISESPCHIEQSPQIPGSLLLKGWCPKPQAR